ncbi:TPA: CopG family transcriptional regulator, partial [Vibrio parahaemolyticus]|nr:CopG family transcriptional regulator [Vibrio parahaemolyticus]
MAFNKKIDSNNQEKNIEKALENAVSPNTSYKKIEIKKDKIK